MSTLNVRLILTDHSPLPVPERPYEGVSWSVGCDAFFVGLSTLVDDEALAAVMYKCSNWKEKCGADTWLVETKKPCWKKKCSQLVALIMYVQMHNSFCLKFMCLCLGKKQKRCLMHVLMNGNTLYAYKKMCNINNMLCEKELWWVLQREIVAAYQTLESVHRLAIL